MTFDELPIYVAIHNIYPTVDEPRSDAWLTDRADELCRLILAEMPVYRRDALLRAWSAYGKSAICGGGTKKLELTVAVAMAHGRRCFWADRGKGECSPDLTIDRLIAGGDYSVDNCVIACSRHNTQRNNLSVEEYLSMDRAASIRNTAARFLGVSPIKVCALLRNVASLADAPPSVAAEDETQKVPELPPEAEDAELARLQRVDEYREAIDMADGAEDLRALRRRVAADHTLARDDATTVRHFIEKRLAAIAEGMAEGCGRL